MRLYTTPVRHHRPAVGVRVEGKQSGRVVAYTGDTEPCRGVLHLAAGADVLLHEATVVQPMAGHSTPGQAGEAAAAARARQLVLVHLDPAHEPELSIGQAAKAFGGPVALAHDWMTFDL